MDSTSFEVSFFEFGKNGFCLSHLVEGYKVSRTNSRAYRHREEARKIVKEAMRIEEEREGAKDREVRNRVDNDGMYY